MDKTPSQEMLAHAEKLCAQRGVRLTPQRLEVLRLMSLQQGVLSMSILGLREFESVTLSRSSENTESRQVIRVILQVVGTGARPERWPLILEQTTP